MLGVPFREVVDGNDGWLLLGVDPAPPEGGALLALGCYVASGAGPDGEGDSAGAGLVLLVCELPRLANGVDAVAVLARVPAPFVLDI